MKKILLIAALFISVSCSAQKNNALENVRYTPQDVENFKAVMELLQPMKDAPMSEMVIATAKHFLGTPYVSYTLETEPEMLTINTRETDCILFVEMCLAMCLTAKDAEPSFEKYCDNIRNLRYRNGEVDGYPSRLHYTSEWILQGEARGIFNDISKDLGGSPLDQEFYYMSEHPDSYKQLKDDPGAIVRIMKAEDNLDNFEYWYLPKAELPELVKGIKDGDIVGFNCATPGLDIAHVAYAYWEGDSLTFIHASYGEKKVVINKTPLIEYTNGIKGHNGLRVVRLK